MGKAITRVSESKEGNNAGPAARVLVRHFDTEMVSVVTEYYNLFPAKQEKGGAGFRFLLDG